MIQYRYVEFDSLLIAAIQPETSAHFDLMFEAMGEMDQGMYEFLKGRLIVVRLTLLAATLALVAVGIASIYSVGHPAERE